jgi:hypothetical protein
MKKLFLLLSMLTIKALSAQNVGIGTSTPIGALNIYHADSSMLFFHNTITGSTNADGFFIGNLGLSTGYIWNKENAAIKFGTNNTERLTIMGDGNVGIGYSGPTYKLSVNGTIYSNGLYNNGISETFGTFYAYSTANFSSTLNVSGTLNANGNLAVDGNITTNNGAGIVRSNDANQLVIDEYATPANLVWSLAPGATICCIGIGFTTFTSPPTIAFGRVTNTTNPDALAFTIQSITNNTAQIRVTNIGNATSTATNGTLYAMIIGRK